MSQARIIQVCVGLFVIVVILAGLRSCSDNPPATAPSTPIEPIEPNQTVSTPVVTPIPGLDETRPAPPTPIVESEAEVVLITPVTPTPELVPRPVASVYIEDSTVLKTSDAVRIERLTYSLTEELENSLERKRAEYNQLVADIETAKKILVELRPEMIRAARNAKLAYPHYWRPRWAGVCLQLKYEIKDLEELISKLSNDISDVKKEGRIISQKIKDLQVNGS